MRREAVEPGLVVVELGFGNPEGRASGNLESRGSALGRSWDSSMCQVNSMDDAMCEGRSARIGVNRKGRLEVDVITGIDDNAVSIGKHMLLSCGKSQFITRPRDRRPFSCCLCMHADPESGLLEAARIRARIKD